MSFKIKSSRVPVKEEPLLRGRLIENDSPSLGNDRALSLRLLPSGHQCRRRFDGVFCDRRYLVNSIKGDLKSKVEGWV